MQKLLLCVLGTILVSPAPGLAYLIEADLYGSGDGLLTRDTATGLDWLDLPMTAGLCSDCTGAWRPGQFEWGTKAQVLELWANAGIVNPNGAPTSLNDPAVANLRLLLDDTDTLLERTLGIYHDTASPTTKRYAMLRGSGSGSTATIICCSNNEFIHTSVSQPYIGHYFRRPAPADAYSNVDIGPGQASTVLGGTGTPGGVHMTADVAEGGVLTGEYDPLTQQEVNDRVISGELTALDFALPGDEMQFWELDFVIGAFDGLATVVFSYDELLLGPAFPERLLSIFHFRDAGWVRLDGVVDDDNNTVTVQTDRFSPFALGVVPEPSTALLLAAGLTALAFRRRGRSQDEGKP